MLSAIRGATLPRTLFSAANLLSTYKCCLEEKGYKQHREQCLLHCFVLVWAQFQKFLLHETIHFCNMIIIMHHTPSRARHANHVGFWPCFVFSLWGFFFKKKNNLLKQKQSVLVVYQLPPCRQPKLHRQFDSGLAAVYSNAIIDVRLICIGIKNINFLLVRVGVNK